MTTYFVAVVSWTQTTEAVIDVDSIVRVLTDNLNMSLKQFCMQFPSMDFGNVYFYTASILHWKNLLKSDKYKSIVIESLRYLVVKNKIQVYGFVIMPNHVHFIWEMKEANGKEMPNASFSKFTGHQFLEDLRQNHPNILQFFRTDSTTRTHHFWQRNSLPIHLIDEKMLIQKLNYIHNNPLQEKWQLVERQEDYKYSSAQFYTTGHDEFRILTHWKDR